MLTKTSLGNYYDSPVTLGMQFPSTEEEAEDWKWMQTVPLDEAAGQQPSISGLGESSLSSQKRLMRHQPEESYLEPSGALPLRLRLPTIYRYADNNTEIVRSASMPKGTSQCSMKLRLMHIKCYMLPDKV